MLKKILVLTILVILLTACKTKEKERIDEEKFLFGTYIKITTYHEHRGEAREAMEKAFDEIERIDKKFNSHWNNSIIDKLNKNPRVGVKLDAEGQMLFDEVDRIYKLTEGKFDITVEPLMNLWGFGREDVRLPTRAELDETMEKIDYRRVVREGDHISMEEPLNEIDTGAFLKGYATARAKVILAEEGIESAFITTISSMETLGPKPDGLWRIGIQDPSNPREILEIVNLDGQAMGISGDYQTFVEIEGKRYHHIIDPTTGYPVTDKKLVAVICKDALLGDLYSTAFFVMELEDVMDYVEANEGLDVFIVDEDSKIITSSGFEKYIR